MNNSTDTNYIITTEDELRKFARRWRSTSKKYQKLQKEFSKMKLFIWHLRRVENRQYKEIGNQIGTTYERVYEIVKDVDKKMKGGAQK